jgi:hypothetical protein
MTEQEWLDPAILSDRLQFVADRGASGRKFRLLSCACCRRIWHLLPAESFRLAVEVAEEYADGAAPEEALRAARKQVEAETTSGDEAGSTVRAALWADPHGKFRKTHGAIYACGKSVRAMAQAKGNWRATLFGEIDVEEEKAVTFLVRDIFGNPFRPVCVDPSWLTPTVTALAQTIYTDRAFDAIPILGDALEEAGCTSDDILAHCRSDGPHVLGCWVVDLLLDKK